MFRNDPAQEIEKIKRKDKVIFVGATAAKMWGMTTNFDKKIWVSTQEDLSSMERVETVDWGVKYAQTENLNDKILTTRERTVIDVLENSERFETGLEYEVVKWVMWETAKPRNKQKFNPQVFSELLSDSRKAKETFRRMRRMIKDGDEG